VTEPGLDFAKLRARRAAAHSDPVTRPVDDWATDFDHTDPRWVQDPFPIWDDLRRRCPVAHSDRYGGVWLPTRYEDVAAIAHDAKRFSSRSVVVSNRKPPLSAAPSGAVPPISADPPYHQWSRRVLLPAFSPRRIGRHEAFARRFCRHLVDGFAGRDTVDGASEYAQHIPAAVIADMLGFPPEDGPLFRRFIHHALEGLNQPQGDREAGLSELFGYVRSQIDAHLEHPQDDLTTFFIDAHRSESGNVDRARVEGSVALMVVAGIDTTWSAIGASLWHLASHPDDLDRLRREPSLLPTAIEEFLRAYAPVTMARLVKEDTSWNGCEMKADDWILLCFPAANRDPSVFERADEVVIDRQLNGHAAFGLGAHRCLGKHLARMEIRVALEAWLERIPAFSLADEDGVVWSPGQVRGPRRLPLNIG
jgi:cytochrome P450